MHICRNFLLTPFLAEIIRLKSCFSELKICHIYRERNKEADNLSKKGTEQILGEWLVEEVVFTARGLAPPIFA